MPTVCCSHQLPNSFVQLGHSKIVAMLKAEIANPRPVKLLTLTSTAHNSDKAAENVRSVAVRVYSDVCERFIHLFFVLTRM